MSVIVHLLLFILIISLLGCTGGRSNNEGDANYLRGTIGVEPRFLRGNPPAVVYDGDSFDIVMELYNKGTDPTVVDFYFSGYDPYLFLFDRPNGRITMDTARTQYNTEGGYEVAQSSVVVNLPPKTDSFSQPINGVICYEYRTTADAEICIDPEPNRGDENDVCQATSATGLSGGQGAPVAITSVEQEPQPGKTRFKISVSNVGGGSVLDPAVVGNCQDPRFNIRDYDKIYVECVSIGSGGCLPCEPNNPLLITGGKGYFFCKADGLTSLNAYKTILKIDLRYGYKDSIQTNIIVKPSE